MKRIAITLVALLLLPMLAFAVDDGVPLSTLDHEVLSKNGKGFIRLERAKGLDGVFREDVMMQDISNGHYPNIEEYVLDGGFSRLEGELFTSFIASSGNHPEFSIRGDGAMLYHAKIDPQQETADNCSRIIDVDVSTYQIITLELENCAEHGIYLSNMRLITSMPSFIGTLAELFPDESLAMAVRDEMAKFSINQPVTQDELDRVTGIIVSSPSAYGVISDLTGVGQLSNLTRLLFLNSSGRGIAELPDELFTLVSLEELNVSGAAITELPEQIGDLVHLRSLDIGYTAVSILPDTMSKLVNLRSLDIGNTEITAIPEALYGLNLTELNMAGLPIK